MWLKRSTPQNIVIGGAAGALPPVIGWAAATGTRRARQRRPVPHHLPVDAAAFLGAGALQAERLRPRRRADDAERRGRARRPRRQILVYALILAPVGVLPPAARHRRRRSTASSRRSLGAGLRLATPGRCSGCRDGDARRCAPAKRAVRLSRSSISSPSSPPSGRRDRLAPARRCWELSLIDEQDRITLTEARRRRGARARSRIGLALGRASSSSSTSSPSSSSARRCSTGRCEADGWQRHARQGAAPQPA